MLNYFFSEVGSITFRQLCSFGHYLFYNLPLLVFISLIWLSYVMHTFDKRKGESDLQSVVLMTSKCMKGSTRLSMNIISAKTKKTLFLIYSNEKNTSFKHHLVLYRREQNKCRFEYNRISNQLDFGNTVKFSFRICWSTTMSSDFSVSGKLVSVIQTAKSFFTINFPLPLRRDHQ